MEFIYYYTFPVEDLGTTVDPVCMTQYGTTYEVSMFIVQFDMKTTQSHLVIKDGYKKANTIPFCLATNTSVR